MYEETFRCDQCSLADTEPREWFCALEDCGALLVPSIAIYPFSKADAKDKEVKSFCGVPCLIKYVSGAAPRLSEDK